MFKREDIVKYINNEPVLYLRRWHLLKTPWFKLYLHKFTAPDLDRDPHDHPWDSYIFMLKGKYREELYNIKDNVLHLDDIVIRQGPSFRKMPGKTIHKITRLLSPEVWTIFLCTKKNRDWGFHTKEGWIYWRDYLNDYKVVEG